MTPLAVLTALVFGSATAIGFGLTATAVVFLVLRAEQPDLANELPQLLASCAWFWLLAGASGAGLFAALKVLWWRHLAQLGMWGVLVVIGYVYWPASGG